MSPRFVPSIALILCAGFSLVSAAKKPRIGVVAIQDRKGHSVGAAALDRRLLSLVKNAGFEVSPLRFQPAADVEHQARALDCTYILYTDVVDVHKTAGTQLINTVGASKS